MNFIKKIIEKQADEYVHRKFIRYGKGDYERALMKIKKGKDLKINTSFDYANDLFGTIAENIDEEAEVSGKIIAPYDFEDKLNFEVANFSKRGKLHTAEINTTLTPEQIKFIFETFQNEFLLLNVKSKRFKLKCGKSLPKPGGTIKDNFCKATLPLSLINDFAFDFGHNFKEAVIVHKFVIEDIIVPEECKDDFAQARIMAKRKGKLIRIIDADGTKKESTIDMEV